MTRQEAQKRIDAITAALAGLDPEASVLDFGGCLEMDTPFIQLSGHGVGLEGMKKMAADNDALLEVWPDYYEIGDSVFYMDNGVKVVAIVHHEE